jgi:hypothetical protein
MRFTTAIAVAFGVTAAGFIATSANAATLLTNGGFESGAPSTGNVPFGWTAGTGWTSQNTVDSTASPGPQSGTYYLQIGGQASPTTGGLIGPATLTQTFSDIAGTMYTVSYWFTVANGNTGDNLAVTVGSNGLEQIYSNPNPWTLESFTFTGTGSDTLVVSAINHPEYWWVDNFSVDPVVTATPLPGALPLFANGLGALGLLGWRRKRKNVAA